MQNILSRLSSRYRFCPNEKELTCYHPYQKVHGGLPGEAATLMKYYNLYCRTLGNIQQVFSYSGNGFVNNRVIIKPKF